MHALMRELYPQFRGLTGDGNRQTLSVLAKHIPLRVIEAPTGEAAFDWTVPQEWRFREAWVKDRTGRRVVDSVDLNLHVVSHSQPVRATMSWDQLRPHLHTLPDRPDAVPYRHAFFQNTWGFCLSHHQLMKMQRDMSGPYEVCINADFVDGSLTWGEAVLPGHSNDQVLISAHLCHPSLCNDNLSGIVLATALARRLMQRTRRYTYRFVFAPATLGAIAFLSRAGKSIRQVRHGLVLTGVGDPGPLTYKRSRRGNAPIDIVAASVVEAAGGRCIDFTPTGYDERQYGSPGFNLPMGTLMRSEPGTYPQYHTSDDNLDFVTPQALADSLTACERMINRIETREHEPALPATDNSHPITAPAYRNMAPFGEPQLSRRGVFDRSGVTPNAAMWMLNMSDGSHDLMHIAARSGISAAELQRAADVLSEVGLLRPLSSTASTRQMI